MIRKRNRICVGEDGKSRSAGDAKEKETKVDDFRMPVGGRENVRRGENWTGRSPNNFKE